MKLHSEPASFADIKQGDHVRLFNAIRVEWSLPAAKVDEVKDGAVKSRGAWYFESDDWAIEVVNPDTCQYAML